jgi:hypothetical protein
MSYHFTGPCRAKFITGTVQALLAKPGGGRQWLYSLRTVPYKEASEALCELPGIGPKVGMWLDMHCHHARCAELVVAVLQCTALSAACNLATCFRSQKGVCVTPCSIH